MLLRAFLLAGFLHVYSCMLLPRPVYPPRAVVQSAPLAISYPELREAGSPSARDLKVSCALPAGQQCSCDDVFVLQGMVVKLQEHNRDLTRRTLRLEYVLSELLETMQTSDDVALLERRTCSAVVYNENLTAPRPLRLLREGLKKLQHKWSM
jgi:hypothetical protein